MPFYQRFQLQRRNTRGLAALQEAAQGLQPSCNDPHELASLELKSL